MIVDQDLVEVSLHRLITLSASSPIGYWIRLEQIEGVIRWPGA